ncbi:hypothetical protein NE857_16410 [Nocardiopsis exhalans]|uniref:Uncharacterized protein n=1 Tax=Nocardiopsis exhalans TaxID=163604 RepID=A0ABY5DFC7_9ACTN|nr:hypothetical protein [Nocardiopsis exhalans]USY23057.1 hypothetical protein NE857_16410 [Nocardiopsis exhalans]
MATPRSTPTTDPSPGPEFALAVLGPELQAWLLGRVEERVPFRFTGQHLLS